MKIVYILQGKMGNMEKKERKSCNLRDQNNKNQKKKIWDEPITDNLFWVRKEAFLLFFIKKILLIKIFNNALAEKWVDLMVLVFFAWKI